MTRPIRITITLLLIISVMAAGFSQRSELRREINKIIQYETNIRFKKTPGFMIGVIDNDSTYYFRFGSKGYNTNEIYDEHDLFEIGSSTKVFTAGLVEILVQEEIISYDDKVNSFLPLEEQNPRLEDLTIEDLVKHLSGFPKRPSFFGRKEKQIRNPYKFYTKKDLIAFYREYIPSKDEEKKFKYAHTNYALIEYILEEKLNSHFESILRDKIFDPLDLHETFLINSEDRLADLSRGYNRAGNEAPHWDFPSFGGSEGLKSTVHDLACYVKANMGMSQTTLDHILPTTHNTKAATNFDDNIYVGKAWHILEKGKKHNVVMHTGTTGGHKSFMAFVDETKTGVVILSNSAQGVEDLGILILRMINNNWKRKT